MPGVGPLPSPTRRCPGEHTHAEPLPPPPLVLALALAHIFFPSLPLQHNFSQKARPHHHTDQDGAATGQGPSGGPHGACCAVAEGHTDAVGTVCIAQRLATYQVPRCAPYLGPYLAPI